MNPAAAPSSASPIARPSAGGRADSPRQLRQWMILLGSLACLLGAGLAMLRHVPDFYSVRLQSADAAERQKLSKRFLNRGTRLISDIQNSPAWMADFEEAHINAWLAEDFQSNHAEQALPEGVTEPRVSLENGMLRVGFRYKTGLISTVVQIGLKAWIPKRNLVAVELEGAWAGALPLPTSHTRSVVEQFAHANHMTVAWKRNGRRLVALLEFPRGRRDVVLQKVEIDANGIHVRGGTGRLPMSAADYAPSAN